MRQEIGDDSVREEVRRQREKERSKMRVRMKKKIQIKMQLNKGHIEFSLNIVNNLMII